MIDLHSHMLPGVDDGAPNHQIAFEMARMAVADGIKVMACTPHFMPGLYDNTPGDIRLRIAIFQEALNQENIPLKLVVGSDAHIRPDFLSCVRDGRILRLNDSRYVLFEPSLVVAPRHLDSLLYNIAAAGYVPILTHPERLQWIEHGFDIFQHLFQQGVWMQITAGSLTGRFGKRPRYWAHRMLAEGMVHILATDAHNTTTRPPLLAEAANIAAAELGREEAHNLVQARPNMILEDETMDVASPATALAMSARSAPSFFKRLFASG